MQVEPTLRVTSSKLATDTYQGPFVGGMSKLALFAVTGTAPPEQPAEALESVDFTEVDIFANGVNIQIDAGGETGQFSPTALVLALTSGLVLSQMAGLAVRVTPFLP